MRRLVFAIAMAVFASIALAQQVDLMVVQALADPAVGTRLADLGLDMASREQQSPEGLAAFHKS